MTQKFKKLVWAVPALLFITFACASPELDEAQTISESNNCGLNLAIEAPEQVIYSDQEIQLSASKNGEALVYTWSVFPSEFLGNFSDQQENRILFTIPNFDGSVEINLRAEVGNCVEKASLMIEIVLPTQEAISTDMPNGSNEENVTLSPTSTLTATSEHTVEATLQPASTEVAATNTPTNVPTATLNLASSTTPMPQPTSTQQPAKPVITYYEILPGSALALTWEWESELNLDQNYAVRFWSKTDSRPEARYSITWTKEHSYRFSVGDYPPGEYYMNVAVMVGPSVGEHFEVVRSEDILIYVPPVEPTLPPP